jgi:PleD family two-component response regulator
MTRSPQGTRGKRIGRSTNLDSEPRLKPRLVIVDDDLFTRRALAEALGAAGYLTFGTEKSPHILEQLSNLRPDIILLDMLLPEIKGLEILARLGSHAEDAHVPIVILSNLGDSLVDCVDPEAAKAIGVAAVVPKSAPLSTLLDHLSRIITR